MKKLIAAALSVVSIALLSASSNASGQLDTSNADPNPNPVLTPEAAVATAPEQPQELFQRGVCNLSCTACTIGLPCPKDPDTGHNQFCVPNCP